jgi:hypothetical protein
MNAATMFPTDFPGFVTLETPPKGWRQTRDPLGPIYLRRDLHVRVSEHVDDGRRVRMVSVAGLTRAPAPAALDDVVNAFLRDGHGVVSVSPSPRIPSMLVLTRSLDPVDPNSLVETGARMAKETRADWLIEAAMRLRSRRGWLKTVLGLYAIVSEAMPSAFDHKDPVHVALKAVSLSLERFGREHDKLAKLLPSVARRGLQEIESARGAMTAEPADHQSALDACMRSYLAFICGERERAMDCARFAAAAIVTGGARTSASTAGEAFLKVTPAVRFAFFSDGENAWGEDERLVEEESSAQVEA